MNRRTREEKKWKNGETKSRSNDGLVSISSLKYWWNFHTRIKEEDVFSLSVEFSLILNFLFCSLVKTVKCPTIDRLTFFFFINWRKKNKWRFFTHRLNKSRSMTKFFTWISDGIFEFVLKKNDDDEPVREHYLYLKAFESERVIFCSTATIDQEKENDERFIVKFFKENRGFSFSNFCSFLSKKNRKEKKNNDHSEKNVSIITAAS